MLTPAKGSAQTESSKNLPAPFSALRTLAAALALTGLILQRVAAPLVDPGHIAVYHWSGPASTLFLPVLLDLLLLWLAILAVLFVAARFATAHRVVWSAILLSLPFIVGADLPSAWRDALPDRFGATLVLTILSVAIPWAIVRHTHIASLLHSLDRLIAAAESIFTFGAIASLLLLGQLFWFGWQARSLNAPTPTQPAASNSVRRTGPRKVIWIVFDELAYRQLYEHRFPRLQLPAFDKLAAQSTVFTHVLPAGTHTEEVVPALLTGTPVDAIRSSSAGLLSIHAPGDAASWRRFDPHETVFQDARNAGFHTTVVGWYNPYCRILPEVLDRCLWSFAGSLSNGMSPDATIGANMLRPIPVAFNAQSIQTGHAQEHIADYQTLAAAAMQLLDDPHLDFVLLHLPVPHPEGIYSRATSRLTAAPSSYIDNLALADRCLAQLRQRLESNGAWDDSAILVMGDHSWRTDLLWKDSPVWTPEDEQATIHDPYDDRPAYLLKLPGQIEPQRIDAPFPAQDTRTLLDALLSSQLQTREALSAWLLKH